MRKLYISKRLTKDGVTREEAWDFVNFFDKTCILHNRYVRASLLPIRYPPRSLNATCSVVLVLMDVKGSKIVDLAYFYKNGDAGVGSNGNGKFQFVYSLHDNGEPVVETLPPRLREVLTSNISTGATYEGDDLQDEWLEYWEANNRSYEDSMKY